MNGIICIDKPEGMTSFGVVAKVRGILQTKKAGHTGTLDPMATGVLPVMLGGATKFLNYLPDSDKAYRATFLLGKTTDTLDSTGTVTGEYPVTATEKDVRDVLPAFRGTIEQLPPMYSAKSVDGQRLYDLARQGKEIERTPCTVEIKRLELVACSENTYTVDVECSKGTYIRSLIDDIGKALGCGAVMTALQRTRACGFTLGDCVTLEALQVQKDNGMGFEKDIRPVESLFIAYPRVTVTAAQATRFANGGALDIGRIQRPPAEKEVCTVHAPDGLFLGLGQHTDGELKVLRLLTR